MVTIRHILSRFALLFLFLGGLNWGLVGIGILTSQNMNMVNFFLGTSPRLEAVVYLFVGVMSFWGFYWLGQMEK